MAQILLLNGPNLNLLGEREPALYGKTSLKSLEAGLQERAVGLGHQLECLQSNHEGVLIDRVQAARNDGTAFILINPAGYTHTSVALRDALAAVRIPFIEVHLTNVYAREPFRRHSHLAEIAVGTIAGLGSQGYDLALAYALARLTGGRGA